MQKDDVIYRQAAIDALGTPRGILYPIRTIEELQSAQPTDEEIQKMQDLEQVQLEKAYQLGYEDGKKDAQPEIKCIAKVTLTDEQVKEAFEEAKCEILATLPEQKRGRWKRAYLDHEAMGERPSVLYCSVCNQCIAYPVNYCPNCGSYNGGASQL